MECNFSEVADLQLELFLKPKSIKIIFQKTYFTDMSFPELLWMSASVSLATQRNLFDSVLIFPNFQKGWPWQDVKLLGKSGWLSSVGTAVFT